VSDHFRPLDDDPSKAMVEAMFDARSGDWIVSAPGDYQAAAALAMREDGSDLQTVVILEWPGRRNHTTEHVTVRLMMSPEDAIGLAETLATPAAWLIARKRMMG